MCPSLPLYVRRTAWFFLSYVTVGRRDRTHRTQKTHLRVWGVMVSDPLEPINRPRRRPLRLGF